MEPLSDKIKPYSEHSQLPARAYCTEMVRVFKQIIEGEEGGAWGPLPGKLRHLALSHAVLEILSDDRAAEDGALAGRNEGSDLFVDVFLNELNEGKASLVKGWVIPLPPACYLLNLGMLAGATCALASIAVLPLAFAAYHLGTLNLAVYLTLLGAIPVAWKHVNWSWFDHSADRLQALRREIEPTVARFKMQRDQLVSAVRQLTSTRWKVEDKQLGLWPAKLRLMREDAIGSLRRRFNKVSGTMIDAGKQTGVVAKKLVRTASARLQQSYQRLPRPGKASKGQRPAPASQVHGPWIWLSLGLVALLTCVNSTTLWLSRSAEQLSKARRIASGWLAPILALIASLLLGAGLTFFLVPASYK